MIEINTYLRLRKVLKEFKKGTFDFLIIIGSAGLGKTYNARKILGNKVGYINSTATALGLYLLGYEHQDMPIWFDDVESLFEKDKMIGLLKQFCETNETKTIQYNTSWDMEETKNVPKSYETKSKILMTSNSITRLQNKGVQSLLDRAIIINFKPSKEEISTYIRNNFKSIYNKSILESLQIDENFSLRDYIKKVQLKKAGLL